MACGRDRARPAGRRLGPQRPEQRRAAAGGAGGRGACHPRYGDRDVLVGFDGSRESAAAIAAVVELLGDRLGRLTVATVAPYGDIIDQERAASKRLRDLADRTPGGHEFEVLHGHPSTALRQRAIEGGYELIAVGSRGAGVTKALIGSAASELARESKVPVLLVSGAQVLAPAES